MILHLQKAVMLTLRITISVLKGDKVYIHTVCTHAWVHMHSWTHTQTWVAAYYVIYYDRRHVLEVFHKIINNITNASD